MDNGMETEIMGGTHSTTVPLESGRIPNAATSDGAGFISSVSTCEG